MSDHDAELVLGEMDDDPSTSSKAKRSSKQKGSKKSSTGSVDMGISGDDAREALLKSKLEELRKHANINFDDDMPITSPVGSPGDDHLDSLNELIKLKQQLEDARRSEPPEDEDVEIDSFIDVQSLLDNLNLSEFTRPSVPKIDTMKFNELCQQIRDRDTAILTLEAQVREMDREAIDLKEMINERDKLIGSKNEAVAAVQNKFKKDLEERDFELKRTQQVLFDMEKTLSSVQNNWKQEKERLNAEIQTHAARCSALQEKASKLDDIQNELDIQKKEFTEKEAQMMEKSKNQINKLKTQFQNKLKTLKEKHNEELAAAAENDSRVKELENRVAELEEEKGNFLLQLADLEEQQALSTSRKERLAELENQAIAYQATISDLTEKVSKLESVEEKPQQQQQWEQVELGEDIPASVAFGSEQISASELSQVASQQVQELKEELSSALATVTKNQESIKELENYLHSKEEELRSAQVRASDVELKVQLLIEEKNSLVLQMESLRNEFELHSVQRSAEEDSKFQRLCEEKNNLALEVESLREEIQKLRAVAQHAPEIKQATDNSQKYQTTDAPGFIDWGANPATAPAADWWSPQENVGGDWGSDEVQFVGTAQPARPSPANQELQYLQAQVNERDNHIHDLNFQLDSLQTSVNELQVAISSLSATNEEMSKRNHELLDENRELTTESEKLKEEVEHLHQLSPSKTSESPSELSLTVPDESVEKVENISLFRAPDSVDPFEEEKKKWNAETHELKVKNGKIVQKFKLLKEKYDGVLQECQALKQGQETDVSGSAERRNDEELLRQSQEKEAIIAELNDSYASTKERLAEMENQASIWESKVSDLMSELDSVRTERSSIIEEYELSKQQLLDQLQNRVDEAQRARDELVDSEMRQQHEIEALQEELAGLNNVSNRHKTSMQTIAQYEQQISSLSHELHEKTRIVEELSSQQSQFEAQFKALQDEQANTIAEAQTKEQQLIEQINQFRYYLEMNQQQAQTLQQELLQRDQELTHLKEFYDPQIANLTALTEKLDQTKDELSLTVADLTKNQELVKELESSLHSKEAELRSAQVQTSDEAFKFQLLVEEKNNLVLQIESLRDEIEQLRTAAQLAHPATEMRPATDSSQTGDAPGLIDWSSQPPTTAPAADWWSPQENVGGDWGSDEVQFVGTAQPARPSPANQELQYLQAQVNERDNHIHDLNFQLDSLQTSVNELQVAISSLSATNEEMSRRNHELLDENKELTTESEKLKEEVEHLHQLSPSKTSESPSDLSLTVPDESVEKVENISLFRAPDSVDPFEEEKKKWSAETHELKVKNGKIVQKFKLLKEKYDGVLQECQALKQGQETDVSGSAERRNDEELLRQLQEKEAIIAELNDSYASTKERLAEMENQASIWESKVSDLMSELDSVRTERSSIIEEYELSKQQLLDQLQNRVDEAQRARDELVDSEMRQQHEIEALQEELAGLNNVSNRHKTSMQTIAQYEQQISSLSHELHEKTRIVEELSSQQSQFEAQFKALQDEQANTIAEAQTKEQQLIEQINQFRYYLEMNQQQAQTLQQELLQRDQELTHLKEFYDPQIANLTALTEKLDQTKDELSLTVADLTKNQELVKELESSLHSKEAELRSAQVQTSDEAFKFQLLVEEKNNLVLQIESLRDEIEQLRTAAQLAHPATEMRPATDSSQTGDAPGLIDWSSQPPTTAPAADWWSPKEAVAGDWGSEERDQFAPTASTGSADQQLQYLQSQLSEKENQVQDLNFQLERLQVSINELNQGVSSLSAANERFSNQNKQLLDENSKLSSELVLMKIAVQTVSRTSSESPVELAGTVPAEPGTSDEKQKLSAEVHELKVKNGKMLQKFKVLKDKYDALAKEHEGLKRKNEFSLEGAMEEELLGQLKQKDEANQENAKIIMELRGEKEQLAQRLDLLERANDKLLEMKEEQGRYIEQLLFEKKQLEQEISGLKWKLEEVAESNTNVVPSGARNMEAIEGRSVYQEDLEALRNQNYLASQEITSLQQDNADLISAVEELNRRNLLLQSGQSPQPVQVQATATVTTSGDVPSQSAEVGSDVEQLRHALEHEKNEKAILERKIELLQTKILEIEASEIRAFEESFMLKSMTRILEMDNSKYQDELQQLLNNSGDGDGGAKVRTLQNEVLRLVDTLQERDKRCEELTCEITRLLEERDGLQLKLSNVLKHNVSLNEKCNEGSETSSIEVPTFDKEELQMKLAELEQVNFSINLDLRREREARRIVQEQLLFSQSSRIYRDLTRSKPVSLSPIKSSSPLPPRTPVQMSPVTPVPASIPPPVQIFTTLTVTPPDEGAPAATASAPPSPIQQL